MTQRNSKKSNISAFSRAISNAQKNFKTYNDNQPKSEDSALRKFFVDCLRDMYWAEKKLVTALPKMNNAAACEDLQKAFSNHLRETKTHVTSLEKVFRSLGETARAKKCEAMDGLVAETKTIISETEADTATRDVGLILAAQKVEHYEIASYGGLCQLAKTLGEDKAAELLGDILEQEKNADELLSKIAEHGVNYDAAEEEAA
jgi:ferritin-like metal-binding protein YciE